MFERRLAGVDAAVGRELVPVVGALTEPVDGVVHAQFSGAAGHDDSAPGAFFAREGEAGAMSAGGTYVLVFALVEPATLEVGALGEQRFPVGGYCYVGSALGSGGFSRIDRHRRVAAGEHGVRHWHIDYFGGHPETELIGIERVPGRDCECALARDLGEGPVPDFGASDCDCETHLSRFPDREVALSAASAGADRRRRADGS